MFFLSEKKTRFLGVGEVNHMKHMFYLLLCCMATAQADCQFKSWPLKGKVQFVDSFPDIKIQYVDAFPDIKVKMVDSFPDDCGEWQKVESFPDFKVQVVTSFPDLKVQLVNSFPGMSK